MEDLENFVSDYTKDKKHLHLVIGMICCLKSAP